VSNGAISVTPARFPLYAQVSLLLLGACAIMFMLLMGEQIILPFVVAAIVATLDSARVRELL
jgi:hypothetical protein